MNKPAIHIRISRLLPLYRLQDEPACRSACLPEPSLRQWCSFLPKMGAPLSHSPLPAADSPVSRSYLLSFRRGLPTHLPVSSPHLVHYPKSRKKRCIHCPHFAVHLLRIVTYGGFHLRIIEINQIRIPLGMSLLANRGAYEVMVTTISITFHGRSGTRPQPMLFPMLLGRPGR